MLPTLVRRVGMVAATGVVLANDHQEKLPIYPIQSPEILLQETPSALEKQIGQVRKTVSQTYGDAHAQVQGVVSKWIGVEHSVENRVKSLISPTEPVTPGILYVGIATLSGSVFARNRIILTRLALPPTLLILSMNQFLPQTTHNIRAYLSDLEDTYLPTFAQKHETGKAHSTMGWEMLKEKVASGRESFGNGVESAVDKLQEATGLKVKEAMGWGNRVESKVLDAVKSLGDSDKKP
ncbi:apolipo protein O-domain-containing protein [Mucidula mucida]|nr:apolipo protein O-domain-containing protein [Mucidula mucida]